MTPTPVEATGVELGLTVPVQVLGALADLVCERVAERLNHHDAASRYLDLPAAATYLALPDGQLRKLVQANRIPHIRPGRRIIFDRLELDAWMREHSVPSRNAHGLVALEPLHGR